jgi:hypothetical protein
MPLEARESMSFVRVGDFPARTRSAGLSQRPTLIIDPVVQNLLDGFPSQRKVFVEILDDFPAQCQRLSTTCF